MRTRFLWLTALGLGLCLTSLPPGPSPAMNSPKSDTQPTQEGSSPAKSTGGKPDGLVGTVAAVGPDSRTLVVDVPLGTEVLRIGTEVIERTKITAGGAPTSLERLKQGAVVRPQYHRIETGDEATSVEVLHGST